jgi:hypothetical protein
MDGAHRRVVVDTVTVASRGPIDARRRLTPRQYLVHPDLFGEVIDAEFAMPDGGDEASMEIARTVHLCFAALRHAPASASGAALARRFRFSRQTWSATSRGLRWPGHTVLIAVLVGLREAHAATNRVVADGQQRKAGTVRPSTLSRAGSRAAAPRPPQARRPDRAAAG